MLDEGTSAMDDLFPLPATQSLSQSLSGADDESQDQERPAGKDHDSAADE